MSASPVKKEGPVKSESSLPNDGWQEIPLRCCTIEDVKDARYHIMKFQSKQDVNIVKDFTKPVRLHRKDPQNIQFQLTRKEIDEKRREGATQVIPENGEGEEEMDLSQVAPDGGGRKNKKNMFKRKTRQISLMDESKRKLRFEEFYPWVIEDYDGKNIYVGNYEAGSSDTQQVLFVFDRDGFKMIPAEKVYRFTPRNKYTTLTLEEAEAKMEKKSAVPRWLMKRMEDNPAEASPDQRLGNVSSAQAMSNSSRRMRTVMGGSTSNDRDSDHDDLDFDEEFADDEEAPIMDGDEEENKLSEQKVKKEQLKAAHFDGQSDADVDDDLDDLFETEKSRKVDKEGKKLRKVLNKTEGGVYDSDDDDEDGLNPYLSRSDIENDDDDENEETAVKTEEDGSQLLSGRRAFYATNLGNSFVSIKAPMGFLSGFPRGDWNPQGFKRQAEMATPLPSKKVKIEENKSVSPTPSSSVDLHSAGPNNDLVTVEEVLNIVRKEPLTTKQLLLVLKNRVYAHPDNKLRIINIVKQNLRLSNGMLVLKEEH